MSSIVPTTQIWLSHRDVFLFGIVTYIKAIVVIIGLIASLSLDMFFSMNKTFITPIFFQTQTWTWWMVPDRLIWSCGFPSANHLAYLWLPSPLLSNNPNSPHLHHYSLPHLIEHSSFSSASRSLVSPESHSLTTTFGPQSSPTTHLPPINTHTVTTRAKAGIIELNSIYSIVTENTKSISSTDWFKLEPNTFCQGITSSHCKLPWMMSSMLFVTRTRGPWSHPSNI